MVTGEKQIEYRNPSAWLMARMYDTNRTRKAYTHVRFVNGYGRDKPFFVAKLNYIELAMKGGIVKFSNGLEVSYKQDDWLFHLGDITETGNLK